VLTGNPPGPASTSTPAPETSTKYATVENLASHTEAFMQILEIKALGEGHKVIGSEEGLKRHEPLALRILIWSIGMS
jgi:hypothetical protein